MNLEEDYKVGWAPEKKRSFWQKISWRANFLLKESWGKNFDAILCSLLPASRRGYEAFARLLEKRGIISWEKEKKFITYNNIGFFYDDLPMMDFLDILAYDSDYVKKNFRHNSSYKLDGPYEIGDIAINQGDHIIDAGANYGLFSFMAVNKAGETGKIYAFEPIRKTRELLLKSVETNNLKNILVVPRALGSENKEVEFTVFDNLAESSGYYRGDFPTEKVEQITLDAFVEREKIDKMDFIKADIEGMERELLLGAEKSIKRFKPKISLCTYHRPDDPEILEKIIKSFVPEYTIIKSSSKIYAVYR